MEQRKHWWNGRWGRLTRKDVFLRVDVLPNGDATWHVEQQAGGADGVSRYYEFDSEAEAHEAIRALLTGPDRWRELSPRP